MFNNVTTTVVAIVAVSLAVVVSSRWLTRRRARDNRYGLSFGKHSIGFHFGKLSALCLSGILAALLISVFWLLSNGGRNG